MIEQYAAPEFIAGTRTLNASPDRIPRIDETNRILQPISGWTIVAVPGLIPEEQFFAHLAQRRFPVTVWIRKPQELDYLAEPDIFHDFFGHVPMLTNPLFARFMQAYGEAGPKAIAAGALKMLARLYWYMVEFGLIRTAQGLRAYGSGILSSKGETAYCIESPKPNRLAFRSGARPAHRLPDRRLPANLLRHRQLRTAVPRGLRHRLQTALRAIRQHGSDRPRCRAADRQDCPEQSLVLACPSLTPA